MNQSRETKTKTTKKQKQLREDKYKNNEEAKITKQTQRSNGGSEGSDQFVGLF